MKNVTARLKATAYHEAGHAIAAWRLETRVSSVTVEPNEDNLGATLHSNPLYGMDIDCGDDSPRAQRRAENYMVISLAGPAAQREHNPRSVRVYHGRSDREAVCEVLSQLCVVGSDLFHAYYRLMDLRARVLVQHFVNWRAIEILAQELLQRRTLSGKTLRQFIVSKCFALPPKRDRTIR
jgi:hypothetical protein